ncbi:MAG: CPBP family intramembrane metalloprotease [Myxococcaceae bacterium]|nr:CPBP family intramembrane metalloprotease [Myxococcaceae bacterium]
MASLSPVRAARLLVLLRLKRLGNQLGSAFRRKKNVGDIRQATPGKAKLGWGMGLFVGTMMLVAYINIAWRALANLQAGLGAELVGHGATVQVALVLFAALLTGLGAKELAQPDWDLEWLVTLPMPRTTLIGVRFIERTLVNPTGLLALGPFMTLVAWRAGHGWLSVVLGLALTLVLLAIVAVVRTLVDTGFRLFLSPPQLRNLQATISIAGVLALYVAISTGLGGRTFTVDWAKSLPEWVMWLPPGLAIRSAMSNEPVAAARPAVLLLIEVGLVVAAGFLVLSRQLANGVVASGERESGGRIELASLQLSSPATTTTPSSRFLSPIQARELRLLGRDRNFLVQTLLLPVVILGAQFFFNVRGDTLGSLGNHPAHLAGLAFGASAYALLFSAFQTLNAEGKALWILYCVPDSLESLLQQKARFWIAVSLVYPLLILGAGMAMSGHWSAETIGLGFIAILGVPIYAVIATALGVFGCDPLAQDVQRRVRISYLYLFMLLSSLYGYAIYASSFWEQLCMIVLSTLLALALWQKARDQLPFLLDPTAAPPSRVSLSDGLIAAMMFFVFQNLALLVQTKTGESLPGRALLISFVIGGAVTFGLMRLVYWRTNAAGIPRLRGPRSGRALLWALGFGFLASLGGLGYLHFIQQIDSFNEALSTGAKASKDFAPWVFTLAVIAAPIFEEFIFRGLVFGGLRRTWGPWGATLASAGIFAVVHPPMSVIPVFMLGICAAWAYEKSRMLLAPMLVHAVYNAAVVGAQFLS